MKPQSWKLPLVGQRRGCRGSAVVAVEQPLRAPGQAVWLEKKRTHPGHARLPGSCSKDSAMWLADTRVLARPRNHVLVPGVHLPSPHSWAAPHKVPTWDNHLDLKKPKTKPANNSGARAPVFPQGGFLFKPAILILPPILSAMVQEQAVWLRWAVAPAFSRPYLSPLLHMKKMHIPFHISPGICEWLCVTSYI